MGAQTGWTVNPGLVLAKMLWMALQVTCTTIFNVTIHGVVGSRKINDLQICRFTLHPIEATYSGTMLRFLIFFLERPGPHSCH